MEWEFPVLYQSTLLAMKGLKDFKIKPIEKALSIWPVTTTPLGDSSGCLIQETVATSEGKTNWENEYPLSSVLLDMSLLMAFPVFFVSSPGSAFPI